MAFAVDVAARWPLYKRESMADTDEENELGSYPSTNPKITFSPAKTFADSLWASVGLSLGLEDPVLGFGHECPIVGVGLDSIVANEWPSRRVNLLVSSSAAAAEVGRPAGWVVSSFVLEVMHEWGGRGEQSQGPRPICAITLYSSSVVSQSTPRAVTVSDCLTSCLLLSLLSFHQHSQAYSQHQQAPAAGGQGWGPPCRGLRREALPRCRQIRRAWAVTCCTCKVLVSWASDGC